MQQKRRVPGIYFEEKLPAGKDAALEDLLVDNVVCHAEAQFLERYSVAEPAIKPPSRLLKRPAIQTVLWRLDERTAKRASTDIATIRSRE